MADKKRSNLVNQIIIGVISSVIVLLGAVWVFSADFSTLQTTQKEHTIKIEKLETAVEKIQDLQIHIAEIKTIVKVIRDEQKIIREKID